MQLLLLPYLYSEWILKYWNWGNKFCRSNLRLCLHHSPRSWSHVSKILTGWGSRVITRLKAYLMSIRRSLSQITSCFCTWEVTVVWCDGLLKWKVLRKMFFLWLSSVKLMKAEGKNTEKQSIAFWEWKMSVCCSEGAFMFLILSSKRHLSMWVSSFFTHFFKLRFILEEMLKLQNINQINCFHFREAKLQMIVPSAVAAVLQNTQIRCFLNQ